MTVLFFIIDALNLDYISPRTTPVIDSILRLGAGSRLEVSPTFANRLELLSGNFPATTNSFVAFQFKQGPSYPDWIWNLPGMRKLTTGSFRIGFLLSMFNLLRKGRFYRYPDLTVFTVLNYLWNKCWVEYPNIPLHLLPYLQVSSDICEYQQKEQIQSTELLFGYLSAHGYSSDFIYGSIDQIESRVLSSSQTPDVWIIHYGELDELGHLHGPESHLISQKIHEIDFSISKIIEAHGAALELVLITSDHDMLPISKQVDIISEIKHAFGESPEEFRFFVNGSLVRFAFSDKTNAEKLIAFLGELSSYGRVIPKEEMQVRGIPVDPTFANLVFWAHPGIYFWPNYYHRAPYKGMHTYFDHTTWVPFILRNFRKQVRLAEKGRLIDVFPTLVDLLDLPLPTIDGESMLLEI